MYFVEFDWIELFNPVASFENRNDSAGINNRWDVDAHVRNAVSVEKINSEWEKEQFIFQLILVILDIYLHNKVEKHLTNIEIKGQ